MPGWHASSVARLTQTLEEMSCGRTARWCAFLMAKAVSITVSYDKGMRMACTSPAYASTRLTGLRSVSSRQELGSVLGPEEQGP
jgi:hypothetical protein